MNSEVNFRVELGLSIIETHNFVLGNVSIPVQFSSQGLQLDAEESIEVLPFRAVLQSRFNEGINLDFINSINVYLIDPDGLRRRELFYLDFVPFGRKEEIELIPTLVNIFDLVENDQAVIEVSLDLRQFPPQSFEMLLDMQFSGFLIE